MVTAVLVVVAVVAVVAASFVECCCRLGCCFLLSLSFCCCCCCKMLQNGSNETLVFGIVVATVLAGIVDVFSATVLFMLLLVAVTVDPNKYSTVSFNQSSLDWSFCCCWCCWLFVWLVGGVSVCLFVCLFVCFVDGLLLINCPIMKWQYIVSCCL